MVMFVFVAIIGHGSVPEPLSLGCVILIIAGLNTYNGLKDQRETKKLKDKVSIRFCNVLRNGNIQNINTNDLVVGDIVLLQSGEQIYADGYLIDGHLKVDNSVLNGESKDCKKIAWEDDTCPYNAQTRVPTGDDYTDEYSLFAGTLVTEGEGKMVVTNVGIGTETYPGTVNGKTIKSIDEIEETKTSLQIQLDDLADQISKFGYIGAIIVFVVLLTSEILKFGGCSSFFTLGVLEVFLRLGVIVENALTIIAAAVPEGLPAIIKILTAQNANLMIKNNVLAKNANKIPEAGNIQLLCTDKTGTLTGGKLVPVHLIGYDGDEIREGTKLYNVIMNNVVMNSSSTFDSEGNIVGGNATDRALLSLASPTEHIGIINRSEVIKKKEFNSAWKYSAVQTQKATYYKGAPEKILEKCTQVFEVEKYGEFDKEKVLAEIKKYTSKAMRCIAFAVTEYDLEDEMNDGLVYLGFVAIRDDIRPEVPDAVKQMHDAGVQVMMITGDVLDTAVAIATDCGIYTPNSEDLAFTATTFANLADEYVKENLKNIKVIARATPDTKLRVVRLAQECKICCGMGGDGSNDAPALKGADVGFSMGSGTDVCKEAGDIIITDDNFVSITRAVLLGRTFMHNVMKFLKFQLPINIGLVVLSIFYPLILVVEALTATQILVVNIVMDSLNSLSFGGEPAKAEYMLEKPIPKGSKLLSKETISQIAVSIVGFLAIFGLTFVPQIRAIFPTEEVYASARFALLIFVAVVNGFNIRTDGFNLFKGISKNPLFVVIAILIFASTFALVQFAQSFVGCVALSGLQWAVICGLSLLIVPIDFVRKYFVRRKNND